MAVKIFDKSHTSLSGLWSLIIIISLNVTCAPDADIYAREEVPRMMDEEGGPKLGCMCWRYYCQSQIASPASAINHICNKRTTSFALHNPMNFNHKTTLLSPSQDVLLRLV